MKDTTTDVAAHLMAIDCILDALARAVLETSPPHQAEAILSFVKRSCEMLHASSTALPDERSSSHRILEQWFERLEHATAG